MGGEDRHQTHLFSYVSPERRVPADHPLRPIRVMVDAALEQLSPRFEVLYSHTGRPSVPPEKLLRALLLQVFYSVRSEALLSWTPQKRPVAGLHSRVKALRWP